MVEEEGVEPPSPADFELFELPPHAAASANAATLRMSAAAVRREGEVVMGGTLPIRGLCRQTLPPIGGARKAAPEAGT